MRQTLSFKVDDHQERAVDMEDLATIRRIKLEQCVQLATFQADATQVKMLFVFLLVGLSCFISR